MGKVRLKKTKYTLAAPVSLRIAVLADFHEGDPAPALQMLEKDPPDLILLPGDQIRGHLPDDQHPAVDPGSSALQLLRGCVGIAATYCSLGNHEWAVDEWDLELLRSTGAVVLDNEWAQVQLRGETDPGEPSQDNSSAGPDASAQPRVLIGGLSSGRVVRYRDYRDRVRAEQVLSKASDDMTARRAPDRYPFDKREVFAKDTRTDHDWLDFFEQQDGYKILLSHHPEYWAMRAPHLEKRGIDLVLSGHAHGGQICLCGRGLFAPGQGAFPKYTNGVHEGARGRMIISRGMSNPQRPIPRWGNPCEILELKLGSP